MVIPSRVLQRCLKSQILQFMTPSNKLGRRLKSRKIYPKNATELEVALKEEWSQIPYNVLHNLIESVFLMMDGQQNIDFFLILIKKNTISILIDICFFLIKH